MFLLGTFKGVHAQVGQSWRSQLLERRLPYGQTQGILSQECHLPVVVTQRRDAAVVGPVDKLMTRPRSGALECGPKIVTVEMNLIVSIADLLALHARRCR